MVFLVYNFNVLVAPYSNYGIIYPKTLLKVVNPCFLLGLLLCTFDCKGSFMVPLKVGVNVP